MQSTINSHLFHAFLLEILGAENREMHSKHMAIYSNDMSTLYFELSVEPGVQIIQAVFHMYCLKYLKKVYRLQADQRCASTDL